MQHTITIDLMNKTAIDKKIQKLANKAKKYGNDDITIEYGEPYMVPMTNEAGHKVKIYVVDVIVTGSAPLVDGGWEFLARVELMDGDNLVHNFSEKEVNARFRSHSDDCEHCKKARRRNDVFVFEKEGNQIAVGRQCLKDFLGSEDPAKVIYRAAFFEKMDDFEKEFGGMGSDPYYPIYDILTYASASIRKDGFISKKMALDTLSTSDKVLMAFNPRGKSDVIEIEDQDRNLANEVKDFFIEAEPFTNDYMENLRILIGNKDHANSRHFGLVVSGVSAYLRIKEEQKQRSEIVSGYLGEVKERLRSKEVEIVSEIYLGYGAYGDKYLYKMIDTEGNHITWFTQKQDLQQGDKIVADMTVKGHSEFKEIQQTNVTRVKIMKKI